MSFALSLRVARHQKPSKSILFASRSKHVHYTFKRQYFHTSPVYYKKRQDDLYNSPHKVRSSPFSRNTLHKSSSFSFPEEYPQLFALPIMKKPLFPGFYKSIFIRDPFVANTLKSLIKRGQPYVGVFLIRKEEVDIDIITSIDQVYSTGVFAQITNIFSATQNGETGYSVILYPHRRIKMKELVLTSDIQFMGKLDDCSRQRVLDKNNPSMLIKKPLSTFNLNKNDLFEEHMISLVNVENLIELPFRKTDPTIQAMTSEISTGFKEIARLNPTFRDQITSFTTSPTSAEVFKEPSKLADFTASISLGGESSELQQVLNTTSIEKRLQLSLKILKKELWHVKLQEQISKEADSQITKIQRENILLNELKRIKKELGTYSDVKEKWVATFKERTNHLIMPESTQKVYEEEISKFTHLEPSMTEFNMTRDYLDWITQVPWGKKNKESYNINQAKKILDEDHYGLKDVKDHILEFIAMSKLRGSVQGKVLCLCGPPGVGKTSIGKSVARALDRPFYRFSVGGLSDVAEIKGHRRTYVGAMPGKIVQALKKVQAENPLVLIDEVDKMGESTHGGAPAFALLELLDPEQNNNFLDHYLDIPVDLSKVLFVCTANTLDTIPAPLLDRMEVIQISGYTTEEKENIALKHLIPTSKESAGLHHLDVSLSEDAVHSLINYYCRENGVRNLKKQIDKIFRKVVLQMVQEKENRPYFKTNFLNDQQQQQQICTVNKGDKALLKRVPPLKLNAKHLKYYLGPEEYHSNRLYDKVLPPGIVMALVWSDTGYPLFIESVLESSSDNSMTSYLLKTGNLSDVVKESTNIAYTFSKSLVARKFPKNHFFDSACIHLHFPEGSTPKDDPAAGIAMTTSLLSLAYNTPISPNIAMTGEITITGKILKVSGIKDKILAAKRSGVNVVFYPKENQQDWDMLDDYITKGITGIPITTYYDVFQIVFENTNRK